jgi:hypothetical protein
MRAPSPLMFKPARNMAHICWLGSGCVIRVPSDLRERRYKAMRMRAIDVIQATKQFIVRILDVQLPMAGAVGLRTH